MVKTKKHDTIENSKRRKEETNMIAYIKGKLEIKTKGYIVVETGGIGYKIFMSETAIERLEQTGLEVKIFTYMRVREDDVSLYGFLTNEELRMFELLISVSGVGAKSAISILSNIAPSRFALAVISNDVAVLKKLPGIGAKSAQRIILELKDKLKTEEAEEPICQEQIAEAKQEEGNKQETMAALQVLGYSRKEIEEALENIQIEGIETVEEMIKKALKQLAK